MIDTKLPLEIREALEKHQQGDQLDKILSDWRRTVEAKNWLNNWVLSEQDQAFIKMHNEYLRQRKML